MVAGIKASTVFLIGIALGIAMEIAFEESVSQISQTDLSFMCAALNVQMREHYAPSWQEEPWPVRAYPDVSRLPIGTFWPISIMSELDIDGALGYHSWKAGLSYGRVRWSDSFDKTCITASHETLELRLDPLANRWVKTGSDKFVAIEACDPVQGDSYEIKVALFNETRVVKVSDFVLPAYFVQGAKRPYSYLDNLDKNAFDMGLSRNGGGYLITRDSRQNVTNYFGKKSLVSRVMGSVKEAPSLDQFSRGTKRRSGSLVQVVEFRADKFRDIR